MVICVYGAASDKIDDIYKKETEKFGAALAKCGHSLIYGAGATGLMGACARGVSSENGEITGVTPHFMHDIEDVYDKCTTLINTDTMAERKAIMENNADVFVITPGGIGTYDEFFQALTLKQLDRFDKPIIVFNINGYYNMVDLLIKTGISEKFISKEVENEYVMCDTYEDVIKTINEYANR